MNLGKIRARLEHTKMGRKIDSVLRKSGVVHMMHSLQYANKRRRREYEPFAEFYENHKKDFDQVADILEDEMSKETYRKVIQFRMTFDMQFINAVNIKPQYFLKDILPPCEDEVFVDGGAYIGDTAKDFIQLYQKGNNAKMYLWEPDEHNASEIIKVLGSHNYEVKPYAMWNERTTLTFLNDGTSTAGIASDGIRVSAESIDNIHRSERVTFIKMDIEGAEIEALMGAEQTIKKCKPKLAICIYHKPEHLYRIPLIIKELVPDYKIYVRHHSDTCSETVCYAVV